MNLSILLTKFVKMTDKKDDKQIDSKADPKDDKKEAEEKKEPNDKFYGKCHSQFLI